MRHSGSAVNNEQWSCERIAAVYNPVPDSSTQNLNVTLLRKTPVSSWRLATYHVFFGAIDMANIAACAHKSEWVSEVQSTERSVSLSPESPARVVLAR